MKDLSKPPLPTPNFSLSFANRGVFSPILSNMCDLGWSVPLNTIFECIPFHFITDGCKQTAHSHDLWAKSQISLLGVCVYICPSVRRCDEGKPGGSSPFLSSVQDHTPWATRYRERRSPHWPLWFIPPLCEINGSRLRNAGSVSNSESLKSSTRYCRCHEPQESRRCHYVHLFIEMLQSTLRNRKWAAVEQSGEITDLHWAAL